MESWKSGNRLNLFARQELRHKCREPHVGTAGGMGRGGANWEGSIDAV